MFTVPVSKNSRRGMTRGSQLAAVALVAVVAGVTSHASATVVFNDTFGSGSNINSVQAAR